MQHIIQNQPKQMKPNKSFNIRSLISIHPNPMKQKSNE